MNKVKYFWNEEELNKWFSKEGQKVTIKQIFPLMETIGETEYGELTISGWTRYVVLYDDGVWGIKDG